jgi:hypothetical protein
MVMATLLLFIVVPANVVLLKPVPKLFSVRRAQVTTAADLFAQDFFSADGIDAVSSFGFDISGFFSGTSGTNLTGFLGLLNNPGFSGFSRPLPNPPSPTPPSPAPAPLSQIPSVYYARDINPSGNGPYPTTNSDAKRAEFLQLFDTARASPVETFDRVAPSSPVILNFRTIGQVTLSGATNISAIDPPFGSVLDVDLGTCCPAIQFSAPVIAVGFYVIDLEYAFRITIQAKLNGEPATVFVINPPPSSGASLDRSVVYFGFVHVGEFDSLEFPVANDRISIDFLSVFKSSELL